MKFAHIFFLVLLGSVVFAQAEVPLKDKVRAKQLSNKQAPSPYWDALLLKQSGNCPAAIEKLEPIARQGTGFEEAQTALGECLLTRAGALPYGANALTRARLLQINDYQQGIDWIEKAANTGDFNAQAILIELHAIGIARTADPIEGAKWAHLYLANPARQNLGVPILAENVIDLLRDQMSYQEWLLGKERARYWTPAYETSQNLEKDIP